MATPRSVRDDLVNIIDYLTDAQLVLYANAVSVVGTRVSFHSQQPAADFLTKEAHHSLHQYLTWVKSGAYSALLFDGSLLQFDYHVGNRQIVKHRLAFIPAPYSMDLDLLASGEALMDIVDLYQDADIVLKSPVRFDYDPASSAPGHPAAHLTINSSSCRVPCIAPVHPLRFVDFVFRNFFSDHWRAHEGFFDEGPDRHLEHGTLSAAEMRLPHIVWSQ